MTVGGKSLEFALLTRGYMLTGNVYLCRQQDIE